MTAQNETTATLIFAGEKFISLPKIAEIIRTAFEAGHANEVTVSEASLTELRVTCAAVSVVLSMRFEGDETLLSLRIERDAAQEISQQQAQLARLVYPLAKTLPIAQVIWAGTALRIPRDRFVTGLAAQFEGGEAPAKIAQIAPRRVVSTAQTAAPRPRASADLARLLPVVDAARPLTANDNAGAFDHRYDAHVETFYRQMRVTLLRPGTDEEIEAAEEARGPMPVEVRLSTWAVSLSIATVSLPVAAPLMIYNVARGEDMRVASLAMGLAGFFLALGSSGAMAAVTGM